MSSKRQLHIILFLIFSYMLCCADSHAQTRITRYFSYREFSDFGAWEHNWIAWNLYDSVRAGKIISYADSDGKVPYTPFQASQRGITCNTFDSVIYTIVECESSLADGARMILTMNSCKPFGEGMAGFFYDSSGIRKLLFYIKCESFATDLDQDQVDFLHQFYIHYQHLPNLSLHSPIVFSDTETRSFMCDILKDFVQVLKKNIVDSEGVTAYSSENINTPVTRDERVEMQSRLYDPKDSCKADSACGVCVSEEVKSSLGQLCFKKIAWGLCRYDVTRGLLLHQPDPLYWINYYEYRELFSSPFYRHILNQVSDHFVLQKIKEQ